MNSTSTSQGDYGERLSRIEAIHNHHTATSEELQKVVAGMQAELQKAVTEVSILKWMLGIVATAVLYAAAKYILS